MPNPPIAFPANFAPACGLAFANTDNSAQVVSAATPLPVSLGGLSGLAVSNFPATQAVSAAALPLPAGAASEAKLEAVRALLASPLAVGGTVSVGNFPATQAVSAAALPLPTGAASEAKLEAVRALLASPLAVGGTVSVGNFPATQAVSAAALPLPAGAATAAGQATGNGSLSTIAASLPGGLGAKAGAASTSFVVASDLANLEPGGAAITGAAMPAGGLGMTGWLSAIYKSCTAPTPAGTAHIGGVSVDDVADGAVTSGSATSAAVVVSASMAGFAGGSFQITSIGTGNTVMLEQSNDGVTWAFLPATFAGNAINAPTGPTGYTVIGLYSYITSAAQVRARVSTYGSGTVSVTLVQKRVVSPVAGVSLAASSAAIGSVALTAGTAGIGNTNVATGYTDSSAALGAAGVFTGTGRAFNSTFGAQYVAFNAQSQADQAGTLYIEASYDTGANYYPVVSVAASAVVNAAGATSYVAQARVPVMGAFGAATLYRVVYKNGATAQGALRVVSSFTAG